MITLNVFSMRTKVNPFLHIDVKNLVHSEVKKYNASSTPVTDPERHPKEITQPNWIPDRTSVDRDAASSTEKYSEYSNLNST